MLKICEIFFNDQKKKAKYSVAILHCLTDTLKKKTNKNVYLHFANLEIRGGVPHLPALLGQLGAARECL